MQENSSTNVQYTAHISDLLSTAGANDAISVTPNTAMLNFRSPVVVPLAMFDPTTLCHLQD